MSEQAPEDLERRWPRRRVLARSVSVLTYALPVGSAVGASLALSKVLPAPGGAWIEAGDWAALVVVSTGILVLVDRLARRLMPLAALLELSLVFPDHAPRRVAVALRAGTIRNLHARIEQAKHGGIADEPAEAAERIVELVGALHAHDRRTRGHSERVRALTDVLADELKLDPGDKDRLRWSALLHDIGKIHVSPRILNKPGHLDGQEWEAIRRHPEEGARLAAPLEPWLGEWAQVIVQHHERWDGSGYPHGLAGQEISYGARIVALADAYEVMTAARSYKTPLSVAAARRELTIQAGTQFDPLVVRAFLEVSIGRLRWVAGPMSWAAQVPFLGWLRQTAFGSMAAGGHALGQVAGRAASVVATAAGAVGVAVVAGAVAVPAPAPPASAATIPPRMMVTSATADAPAASPVGAPAPATTRGRALTSGSATASATADPPSAVPDPPGAASDPPSPQPAAAAHRAAPAPGLSDPVAVSEDRAGSHANPSPGTPRRRRLGWLHRGLGAFTRMQGGLGQLKHGATGG